MCFHASEFVTKVTTVTITNTKTKTRKLSYRKDDRAMRPMYIGALKIFESLHPRQLFPKFLMGFCYD